MRLIQHWLAHLPAWLQRCTDAERTYRIVRRQSRRRWLREYARASNKQGDQ